MYSQKQIKEELEHIDINYDFSESCDADFKNYLVRQNYVRSFDDMIMLTLVGEIAVGKGKDELGFTVDDFED